MIKTFAQSWLEEFWHTGKYKRVPPDLEPRLLRKMDMLNRATAHKDLQAPPANHLHALSGDREGQWAISYEVGISQRFLEIMFSVCRR